MSENDRKLLLGHPGKLNGMYGKGYKLAGNKNGRWLNDIDRLETVNIVEVAEKLMSEYTTSRTSNSFLILQKHYNFNRKQYHRVMASICKHYGIVTIKELPRKFAVKNNLKFLSNLRNKVLECNGGVIKKYKLFCD